MSFTIFKQPMDNEVMAIDPEKHTVVEVNEKADIALQYLVEHDRIVFTPAEERRVKMKLDMYIMPLLAICFGLSYVDKVTISYAAVYSMRQEIHLVGQQYSWAASIFFFGYLVGQVPGNYLLQRLPLGKFVATILLIWGIMVMLCASVQNFAGLATIRFLMGVFEACIMPCCLHITGMYYKRSEQATRVTVWFGFEGLVLIIGGLVAYGIGHINAAISEWRCIFLIFGGFTVLWSAVVFIFLPDLPLNARFLNDREKEVAIERLRDNRTGVKCFVFKWRQALEVFKDPQVWLSCLWQGTANITNVGASFLPLIIQELGFTGLDTTLYTMPAGAILFVASIAAGVVLSQFKNWRTVAMFILSCPTLVSTIMLQVLPQHDKWARLAAVWLILCNVATDAILLSLIPCNIAGWSKKVATTALVYIFYCFGNIISAQVFLTREAKTGYKTAIRAMLVATVLSQAIVILLGVYYVLENKRRDRILAATPPEVVAAQSLRDEEFLDRTDMEDSLKFRYRW